MIRGDNVRLINSSSGALPIKLIIILVLVLGIGGAAFTFTRMSGKQKPSVDEAELTMCELSEFVVNLADRIEPRYLKVTMTLEVEGAVAKGSHGSHKVESSEDAKMRDIIINVLTKKRFGELLTSEGKTQLKTELKNELNKALETVKVHNIYFTSFAMQ